MAKAQVIIGRHGETSLNAGVEKIRGFIDVALNPQGEQQAIELATQIERYPVSVVYCSSLIRSRQTARVVAKAIPAPMIIAKELLPWMVGSKIQGQPVKQVLPIIQYYSNHPTLTPPDGEPFEVFSNRYLNFLNDILDRARTRNKDICLICHSRNLQLTKAWDAAGRPKDFSYDKDVMNNYNQETPTGKLLVLDA